MEFQHVSDELKYISNRIKYSKSVAFYFKANIFAACTTLILSKYSFTGELHHLYTVGGSITWRAYVAHMQRSWRKAAVLALA